MNKPARQPDPVQAMARRHTLLSRTPRDSPHRLGSVCVMVLLLFTVGCQATRYRNRGNDALAAGRYAAAVGYMERALEYDPDLLNDPAFAAALNDARFGAAKKAGQDAARGGRFDDALAHLERARQLKPDDPSPASETLVVRRAAAAHFHRRAIDLADVGKLADAEKAVREAVRFDDGFAPARQSLASLEERGVGATPFADALASTGKRRWKQAEERLRAVIDTSPHHLPARALLYQADAEIARSRKIERNAMKLVQAGRLDVAVVELQKAVDIWQGNAEAIVGLASTTQRIADANVKVASSLEAAKARAWDQALADVREALRLFPLHPEASKHLQHVKQQGADDYVARGKASLKAGELDDAATAFTQATLFQPRNAQALEGLASIADARALAAEKADLLGAALLWAIEANERQRSDNRAGKVTLLRAAIVQRMGFAVYVAAETQPNDRRLADALTAELNRTRPTFLVMAGKPDATDYRVTVDVASLEINQHIARSERRTHSYEKQRTVVNRAYDRLCDQIEFARQQVRFAERECRRLESDCRRAQISRNPSVHSICDRAARSRYRYDRERDRLRQYEWELSRTPRTVVETYRAEWRYGFATHAKTARLRGRAFVTASAENETIGSIKLDREASHRDDTITDANPAIGLPHDPLTLPPDSDVRDEVIAATARGLASEVLVKVVRARAASANASAREALAAGDVDAAIELNVIAALLLDPVASSESQSILLQLRKQLRQTPGDALN